MLCDLLPLRGPCIVARMFGGLGNQLFIYSNAFALSMELGRQLYLDISSGFVSDPFAREYRLDKYNISAAPLLNERACRLLHKAIRIDYKFGGRGFRALS